MGARQKADAFVAANDRSPVIAGVALHNAALSPPQPIDTWRAPYADAGHDVESLFTSPYNCTRCGAAQIDLSEDCAYGEMRRCKPIVGEDVPDWLQMMPYAVVAKYAFEDGCREETAEALNTGHYLGLKLKAEMVVAMIGRLQEEARAALACGEDVVERLRAMLVDDPNDCTAGVPEHLIEAGMAVQDQANHDHRNYVPGETADWDEGMLAAAIFKAMLRAALSAAPQVQGREGQ